MTLYEINDALMACMRETVDEETGEIISECIDPERVAALEMEFTDKVDGIACWIKNLTADAEAMKAEADKLTKRAKAATRKAESLKSYLAVVLHEQKWQGIRAAVSFRQSSAVMVEDVSKLPSAFIRCKMSEEPDKAAIKKALTGGETVPGATLVYNTSCIIK